MSTPAEEIVAEQPQDEPEVAEPEVAEPAAPLDAPGFHATISAILSAGKGLPQSRIKEFRIQMEKKHLDPLENTPAALALASKAVAVYARKKERASNASARQREALRSQKKNSADLAEATDVATDVVADAPEDLVVPPTADAVVPTAGESVVPPTAAAAVPDAGLFAPKKARAAKPKVGLFHPQAPAPQKGMGSLSGLFA
jgi:hypothetical protein